MSRPSSPATMPIALAEAPSIIRRRALRPNNRPEIANTSRAVAANSARRSRSAERATSHRARHMMWRWFHDCARAAPRSWSASCRRTQGARIHDAMPLARRPRAHPTRPSLHPWSWLSGAAFGEPACQRLLRRRRRTMEERGWRKVRRRRRPNHAQQGRPAPPLARSIQPVGRKVCVCAILDGAAQLGRQRRPH